MDLLSIARSVTRHWVISLVVAALTLVGAGYVLVLMPRDYQASASFVLVNPAPGPSSDAIAADPTLGTVNRDNPYLRFDSAGTVGQVLGSRMSGDSVRDELGAQGADTEYSIGPSPTSAQIIDIVGSGTSAAEAEGTLELVTARMQVELHDMQTVYGAEDSALIVSLPVAEPAPAHVVISGTLRTLVGVMGAGVILLFAAISLAEARRGSRAASARPASRPTGDRSTGASDPAGAEGAASGSDDREPAAELSAGVDAPGAPGRPAASDATTTSVGWPPAGRKARTGVRPAGSGLQEPVAVGSGWDLR